MLSRSHHLMIWAVTLLHLSTATTLWAQLPPEDELVNTTDLDFLDDAFETLNTPAPAETVSPTDQPPPAAEPAVEPAPAGAPPATADQDPPPDNPQPSANTWSFGDSHPDAYQETQPPPPQLAALTLALEPERSIHYHNIMVQYVDFNDQPVAQIKTTFLGTAVQGYENVALYTNRDGEVHLLDYPEHTYGLIRTSGLEADQSAFMPMNHEIFAPTFAQLNGMGIAQESPSSPSEVTFQLKQIYRHTFTAWLNTLGLEADPALGHLCGELTSTLTDDLSGYSAAITPKLQPLQLTIGGDSPTVTSVVNAQAGSPKVYYFNDQQQPDPELTATSSLGRYCIFNLQPGSLRLNIKTRIKNQHHNITHKAMITAGHISYLNSTDTFGKVALIRYVVAPQAPALLDPDLPPAGPLSLESSGLPAETLTITETMHPGIATSLSLAHILNPQASDSADHNSLNPAPSRAIRSLMQSWLSRWWDNDAFASTLPPASILYPQVFAPAPHNTIEVRVHNPQLEPTLHRASESVWYGIRPLMLLQAGTMATLAKRANLDYNPAASHVFVEHRFRIEETSIAVAPELWSASGGGVFSPALYQRSHDILRLVYYNLPPGQYQWVLKTTEGQWRAGRVIHTEAAHISVIESGRNYQLGDSLPFQGYTSHRPAPPSEQGSPIIVIPSRPSP